METTTGDHDRPSPMARPPDPCMLTQSYGDLVELNTRRVILEAVGHEVLTEACADFLELLETSCVVYEANGDYALGLRCSTWCRFMDETSWRHCGTTDRRQAMICGRWHCHASNWNDAGKPAIEQGRPVDVECKGGIRLYAVPILAENEVVGSIVLGYGDPPNDPMRLQELADLYRVSVEDLRREVDAYPRRPPFVIELAKRRLHSTARLLGEIVRRTRAERARHDGAALLQLAERAGNVGSFEWDVPAGQVHWSPQYEAIYGLQSVPHASDYATWLQRLHPEDRPRVEAAHAEGYSRHAPQFQDEFRIVRPDGEVRWIEARGTIAYDAVGKPLRVVGVNFDITDRKRATEELQQLTATLEQRVEDRTALAQQRAEQLRQLTDEVTRAEERERRRIAQLLHDDLQQVLVAAQIKLNSVRKQVGSATSGQTLGQIGELLHQALEESRSLTAELSPPVLYDRGLIGGLEWLARQAEEKHHLPVAVVTEPAAEPPSESMRVFLFQIVRELLLNVVKHARARAARIALSRQEDWIELSVTDNGAGYDPASLESGGSSSGFGLFSIRERLALLGGRLQITTAPGQGTQATVAIPYGEVRREKEPGRTARRLAERTATTTRPMAVPQGDGKVRVLVADDHPLLRKGLVDLLLEQSQIDVVGEAQNGQEALDMAFQVRPDVVLMDISMPVLSGIDATRHLTAEVPEVRVIGLSMHEGEDMARAMREAGAVAYLSKNEAAETLLATILAHAREGR